MTSLIPTNEIAEFMRLPDEVRADIELWIGELANVARPIQKSLQGIAARMGVSYQTARRKYDAWREARHWRALLNRSKVPEDRGLDKEFITYWQGLCKQYGRKIKPAHREFIRQFKAGQRIPSQLDQLLMRVAAVVNQKRNENILVPPYTHLQGCEPLTIHEMKLSAGAACDCTICRKLSRAPLVPPMVEKWSDFDPETEHAPAAEGGQNESGENPF